MKGFKITTLAISLLATGAIFAGFGSYFGSKKTAVKTPKAANVLRSKGKKVQPTTGRMVKKAQKAAMRRPGKIDKQIERIQAHKKLMQKETVRHKEALQKLKVDYDKQVQKEMNRYEKVIQKQEEKLQKHKAKLAELKAQV